MSKNSHGTGQHSGHPSMTYPGRPVDSTHARQMHLAQCLADNWDRWHHGVCTTPKPYNQTELELTHQTLPHIASFFEIQLATLQPQVRCCVQCHGFNNRRTLVGLLFPKPMEAKFSCWICVWYPPVLNVSVIYYCRQFLPDIVMIIKEPQSAIALTLMKNNASHQVVLLHTWHEIQEYPNVNTPSQKWNIPTVWHSLPCLI